MEQESTSRIAVIGLGAAGGLAAVLLCKNPYNKVTGFDIKEPFSTLLPTGGGRCNISNATYDIKELVKNYPRGEKFLLSVFYKFGVEKALELFKDLGIETYTQDDKRVFPVSNSSKDVISKLQKHLKCSNFKHIKDNVVSVEKTNGCFIINDKYEFDKVIVATGGKGGYKIAETFNIKVIGPKPSLCSLDIKEKFLYKLSGLSFKDIKASFGKHKVYGDLLFAHKFITGPLVFKISALTAFDEISDKKPLGITLNLTNLTEEEINNEIKNNSKKSIKNVFSKFISESFINEILNANNIDGTKQAAQLNKEEKAILIKSITELKLHATGRIKNSEIVTAGGVDLDEINPKTMEAKLVPNLYFIGEVLNLDGFTGGYNLQACWSTAAIAADNIQ